MSASFVFLAFFVDFNQTSDSMVINIMVIMDTFQYVLQVVQLRQNCGILDGALGQDYQLVHGVVHAKVLFSSNIHILRY